MLTYCYALISNPCERTVSDFLDYVRAHPGCLLTLEPEDTGDMQRAIESAATGNQHPYAAEAEAFMIMLDRRTFH